MKGISETQIGFTSMACQLEIERDLRCSVEVLKQEGKCGERGSRVREPHAYHLTVDYPQLD